MLRRFCTQASKWNTFKRANNSTGPLNYSACYQLSSNSVFLSEHQVLLDFDCYTECTVLQYVHKYLGMIMISDSNAGLPNLYQ